MAHAPGSRPDQAFDEEEFRDQIRPDAVRAVQTFLIIDTIKKENEIEAEKDEVMERVEEIAESAGKPANEVRRNLIKEGRFESLKEDIVQRKAYEWIKQAAVITDEKIKRKSEGFSKVLRYIISYRTKSAGRSDRKNHRFKEYN